MQNFHVCMKTCAEMQAISTFWVQILVYLKALSHIKYYLCQVNIELYERTYVYQEFL